MRGGGQRPFGIFPKIHPFWLRHPSLMFINSLGVFWFCDFHVLLMCIHRGSYLINQSINLKNVGHFFSLDFRTFLCCTFAQSWKNAKMQKCKNAHDRSKTYNSRGNLAIAIDWFCEECKKEQTLTFACFEFWLQFSPCGKVIIILLVKVLSTPCLQILTSSDILKDISFSYLRLTIGGGGDDKNSGP